ncbi:MAG TPA: RNA methyltransferase [Symbiobacteriaceae bacterium]|jgi:tRNA/rRNA methyltransferase/tRNA (cytidine32/uridine32-2'-O)-methyltransferase
MEHVLDSIVVVLYQPQDIVNVAGVIRVMSNFGLRHLRLVEPAAYDPFRLLGIAHHTDALVAATARYGTLAEAVADCAYLLGTTGRTREVERPIFAPRQAAPLLLSAAAANPGRKAALLFGREQDGLPNEALDLCHGIAAISTHPENRSLNLAQAALVLAYELWLAASGPSAADPDLAAAPGFAPAPDLAAGPQREAMFAALESLLTTLYPDTGGPRLTGALSRLRALLLRAAPRAAEAQAFTNLCRHAARVIAGKKQ